MPLTWFADGSGHSQDSPLRTLSQWLRRMGVLTISLVCSMLLLSCQAQPPAGLTTQVMRVVSGQTIEVPDPTGQTALNQAVRLIGISAPAWGQEPWSDEAKAYLADQLSSQTVLLETDAETVDSYGQQLAYVWKDDVLLNEKLAEEGLVMVTVRSPNLKYEQRLIHAQQTARILGRGIWNPENPMRLTPSEFRQQQESEAP
ncbi:MAG: thermonuclease family protein [Cyanobacteria bacterium P01_A01_bin.37]